MINRVPQYMINPAFLKEIKDDHFKLYNQLDNLRAFWLLNDPTILNPEWFRILICEFRDLLTTHFELEETFGYIQHSLEYVPEFCRESQRLRNQHSTLLEQIRMIAAQSIKLQEPERTDPHYTEMVTQLGSFYAAFQDHEQAEMDLIMSTEYETHKLHLHSGIEHQTRDSPLLKPSGGERKT